MYAVESAHFRTVTDTGSNPAALTVWNTLRAQYGLPALSVADLPGWNTDMKAYVKPEGSNLLLSP